MHLCGELEIYFLAGFFLFVRLSTASGPCHSRSADTIFPECPGSGQGLPARQREQLSFGGISTTLVSRPYFRRGTRDCSRRRDLSILTRAQDSTASQQSVGCGAERRGRANGHHRPRPEHHYSVGSGPRRAATDVNRCRGTTSPRRHQRQFDSLSWRCRPSCTALSWTGRSTAFRCTSSL